LGRSLSKGALRGPRFFLANGWRTYQNVVSLPADPNCREDAKDAGVPFHSGPSLPADPKGKGHENSCCGLSPVQAVGADYTVHHVSTVSGEAV
jgi:hypothetical protein